jgi:hypothetical protein
VLFAAARSKDSNRPLAMNLCALALLTDVSLLELLSCP